MYRMKLNTSQQKEGGNKIEEINKFEKMKEKKHEIMVIFLLSVFSTRVPVVNHSAVRFLNKTSHSIQQ